jgi:hypothetical protein
MYSLKEAAKAIDFLLEEYQQGTVVDPARGAKLPASICSLASTP